MRGLLTISLESNTDDASQEIESETAPVIGSNAYLYTFPLHLFELNRTRNTELPVVSVLVLNATAAALPERSSILSKADSRELTNSCGSCAFKYNPLPLYAVCQRSSTLFASLFHGLGQENPGSDGS